MLRYYAVALVLRSCVDTAAHAWSGNFYLSWSCNGNVASCPLTSSAWSGAMQLVQLNSCHSRLMTTCDAKNGLISNGYSGDNCTGNVTSTTTLVTPDEFAQGGVYSSSSNTTASVHK